MFNSKPKPSTTTIIQVPNYGVPAKCTGSLLGGEWNTSLEYDPFWPNDYEKYRKERSEKSNSLTTTAISKPSQKISKSNVYTPPVNTPTLSMSTRPLVDAYSDDDDEEGDSSNSSKKGKYNAIAPPPSLIESTGSQPFAAVPPPQVTETTSSLNMKVSDVAAKIMAKMGYKQGQGLGKNQQGIATALQVEKTSRNSGVIIANATNVVTNLNEEEFTMPVPPAQVAAAAASNQSAESITEIMKNPTKVIMLRNMVGRGEVDPELEPEVREECSKFGEVTSCLIYELNEGLLNGKRLQCIRSVQAPDDQAVRIFVEFSRVESAIKAIIDLNGRYFGGRVVKGVFYNLDQFKKMELLD